MLAASTDVISSGNASLEQGIPRGAEKTTVTTDRINEHPESSLGNGITSRRVVTADWSLNVGEQVHALKTARFTPSTPLLHCDAQISRTDKIMKKCHPVGDVLALGERTLFVLSATGVLKATKMLDSRPMSICVYPRRQYTADRTDQAYSSVSKT